MAKQEAQEPKFYSVVLSEGQMQWLAYMLTESKDPRPRGGKEMAQLSALIGTIFDQFKARQEVKPVEPIRNEPATDEVTAARAAEEEAK